MELWSIAYLEQPPHSTTSCHVSHSNWCQIDADHPDAKRIFCEISYSGKKVYCPLDTPLINCENDDAVFVPYFILERLGADGAGEPVEVRWLSEEAFPEATRIVLRPHDSAFYHADAKEELERELTRIGVIQEGETVLINLDALGGFELAVDIVKTEPATVVLAEGDEVAVEFEEAWDAFQTVQEPPSPEPVAVAPSILPFTPLEDSNLGTNWGTGQRLGGSTKAINPWRDPNYLPKAT